MTMTLRDYRPAKASRSSCGFCESGRAYLTSEATDV
jgi:hypothetical protein